MTFTHSVELELCDRCRRHNPTKEKQRRMNTENKEGNKIEIFFYLHQIHRRQLLYTTTTTNVVPRKTKPAPERQTYPL